MAPYAHILWDWNGTLLNDVSVCISVLNLLSRDYDIPPITPDSYRKRFGFPVIEFYRELGYDFQRESFTQVSHRYMQQYSAQLDHCELQPGAMEFLTTLRQAGIIQSVLSAYEQKKLDTAIAHFALTGFFHRVIGLNDYAANSKITHGLDYLASDPPHRDHMLMVGDTLHDAEVARHMGLDCVLLSCGHQSPERLAAADVPVLSDFAALSAFLTHVNASDKP